MEKIRSGKDVFEITDKVPPGYRIWNIGQNMVDGYLPLCMLKPPAEQPFDGAMEIRKDTLKAIRMDEAQIVLKGAAYAGTRKEMEEYVEANKNAETGTYEQIAVEHVKNALFAMRDLVWE